MDSWRRALAKTQNIINNKSLVLPLVVEQVAERFDTPPAFLSERETISYRTLADRSRGYAFWALQQGLKTGDVVCLIMENSPDYMAIWLGLTRVGAIVSLINTNLVGDGLAYSVNLVAPKALIVGIECLDKLDALRTRLGPGIRFWVHGGTPFGLPRIDTDLEDLGMRLDQTKYRPPGSRDVALYVYTSGTTGLPKAAAVSHLRVMQWSHWFAGMLDTRPGDRMYNCLPMYHSIGGIVATGAMLVNGGTVVLRRRFSASRFWDDVVDCNCTLFQYIGELCRYLVESPEHPREKEHQLRLCSGNGLRRDVWQRFQQRFHIPRILEFYASTEGNFSLYNCEGKPGAIGRIPPFLQHRFSVVLVRFDVDTGEPRRNDESFCIPCSADEPGEAICKIPSDGITEPGHFEGYTDREATNRKILRDVFTIGDAWYRTGDLMRKDRSGYFYFVDRIGDTFRWKGENVSTTELAEVIAGFDAVVDVVVYGVTVPGTEGRAGMAAIVAKDGFELPQLQLYLTHRVPEYAQPTFFRICANIEATATFKPQKQRLVDESYNPRVTSNPIYFYNRSLRSIMRVDDAVYSEIMDGKLAV